MSRIFTLLLFISLFGNVSAQNWQPFSQSKSYFESIIDVERNQEPIIFISKNEILSLNLKTSQLLGDTLQFNPMRAVGCAHTNYQYYNCPDQCLSYFSLAGNTLIKHNDQWSTINENQNWIKLPSADSVTVMLSIENQVYLSNLLKDTILEIFGFADSCKIFEILIFDSLGNTINDVYSNDTLILSKNFGLIQTPIWHFFPDVYSKFKLIDQGNYGENKGFGIDAFQNYKLGTRLEYFLQTERLNFNYWDYSIEQHTEITYQCIIDSIESMSSSKRFFGACKIQTQDFHWSYNNMSNLNTLDSISKTIVEETVELIDPIVDFDHPDFKTGYSNSDLIAYRANNHIELSSYFESEQITIDDSCFRLQSALEPNYGWSNKFRIGVGKLESNQFELSEFPSGSSTSKYYKLTYFKSDSIEYGTPGWTIGVEEISLENEVLVYPNPVENVLHLQHSESILAAKLYSISGDKLFEATQEELKQNALDFSTLPKGIYLLKVQLADHSETHRIVK